MTPPFGVACTTDHDSYWLATCRAGLSEHAFHFSLSIVAYKIAPSDDVSEPVNFSVKVLTLLVTDIHKNVVTLHFIQ